MIDREDPILDAMLEEVLGGRTPPDLSSRIMQSLAARAIRPGLAADAYVEPLAPPLLRTVVPPAVTSASASDSNGSANGHLQLVVNAVPSSARTRGKSPSTWRFVAAVSLVVFLGAGLGAIGIIASRGNLGQPNIAKTGPKVSGEKGIVKQNTPVPGKIPRAKPQVESPLMANANSLKKNLTSEPAATVFLPEEAPSKPAPSSGFPERDYAVQASPDAEVTSFVSMELHRSWKENSVNPSPQATDGEWCRRTFVRLLGRIPTGDETLAFLNDKSQDKRQTLVDKLLTDEQYIEQYARYWAGVWANVLIGRTTGTQDGSLVDRAAFEQYLRLSLAENKPYDKLVYELLTATGSAQAGAKDSNGAVNFVLAGLNENATLVTARTCRVFLGQSLQCAQCHQHPSQDWSQQQYWSLNAFFRQVRMEKTVSGPRVVNSDFYGRKGVTKEGEVYYQQPSGEMKVAHPQFIDGQSIEPSGLLAEVNRREELARFIVRSDNLPRALVNRLWSHFFGFGFTKPIDDMGKTEAASHPELLDRLSKEFVARNYDLKAAIRWIVLSDPFGRSSVVPAGSLADSPQAGTIPLFSHYYTRQMQAEEVYNSLLAAANLRSKSGDKADLLAQARVDWLQQFNRNMGTDDAMEESHFNGSVRQALEMMNGGLVRQTAGDGKDGFLPGLIQSTMPMNEKVEHLFLASLSRKPTGRENSAIAKILANAKDKPAAALEDIWWALLNSNEFILDH
jgi:Protein of unknown function (DUF1549)/Protein of unknown function (DUF1553)